MKLSQLLMAISLFSMLCAVATKGLISTLSILSFGVFAIWSYGMDMEEKREILEKQKNESEKQREELNKREEEARKKRNEDEKLRKQHAEEAKELKRLKEKIRIIDLEKELKSLTSELKAFKKKEFSHNLRYMLIINTIFIAFEKTNKILMEKTEKHNGLSTAELRQDIRLAKLMAMQPDELDQALNKFRQDFHGTEIMAQAEEEARSYGDYSSIEYLDPNCSKIKVVRLRG